MIWMRSYLLFLIALNERSIADDARSLMMFIMNNWQFQCVNTTCLPFITFTVSDVRVCRLACLNNVQCQGTSFYPSTASCQLFDNVQNQNENMLAAADTISMRVISGTRIPPATLPSLINPCLSGIYWNITGVTVAGNGVQGNNSDQLFNPYGIYIDSNNSLYIGDRMNHRLMKYLADAANGTVIAGVTGIAGNGPDQLNQTTFFYFDSNQNLYISDTFNNRVMRWASGASSGSIIAGNGSLGSSLAQLYYPHGVWIDSNSTVFIAEYGNHRVTKWSSGASSGALVAGTGSSGITADKLWNPVGLFYDEINQDLYISNNNAHTVMRWHVGNATGTVIAGVPGVLGFNATLLHQPVGITVDQWKNLYVADSGNNNRIQLFCNGNNTGITIAGNSLLRPVDVKFDARMNLYVSERNGNRITKFNKL